MFYNFRNLIKPIAVQSKEKEDRYVDTYKVINPFFFTAKLVWKLDILLTK